MTVHHARTELLLDVAGVAFATSRYWSGSQKSASKCTAGCRSCTDRKSVVMTMLSLLNVRNLKLKVASALRGSLQVLRCRTPLFDKLLSARYLRLPCAYMAAGAASTWAL